MIPARYSAKARSDKRRYVNTAYPSQNLSPGNDNPCSDSKAYKFFQAPAQGPAAMGGGVLPNYSSTATLRGEVALLEVATGKPVWRHELKGAPNTTLAVVGDSLYVGESEGQILRLALRDGRRLGSRLEVSPIYGALVPAGECLLALWGEHTLVCLDHTLEKVRWERTVDTTWSFHRVLVHGDLVIAGTEEGEVHATDVGTGAPAWTVQLEGPIKGLSTHDGVLYVGTQPGRLYALRLPGS